MKGAMRQFSLSNDAKKGEIIASKVYFERDCVLNVAEKYTDKFYVSIFPCDESNVKISFRAKDDTELNEKFLRQVMNELIDQQVKIDLQKEFGPIKEKIVSYVFSGFERR